MSDLLGLYGYTIIVGSLFAGCLSVFGCLVVSKSTAVQTLTAAQGATFGVVCGLALNLLLTDHSSEKLLPTALGIVGCLGAFLFSEWQSRGRASPEAFFLAIFALLWGLSQLLVGLFPALESHSQSLFLGDIVTLTVGYSWLIFLYSLFLLVGLLFRWRAWCDSAFVHSVLRQPAGAQQWVASFLTLVAIALSIQFLGLLFSLSALFLPTVILGRAELSLRSHLLLCGFLGVGATSFGFVLSLWQPRLLTTPTIGFLLFLLPLLALGALKLGSICKSIAFRRETE